ncbi:hypothetical protein K488DRAFT_86964 [Vararia minispora EC-137]|uniref:Uncharacterized protein n=1 Tax=Vararia minispora EC-137 TaxID=1314806 RepID=A0ACB8QHR0_9AGAM|nr:hypothetical protein K488DRAFT_86964 [Vararia minispora EC-137]
MFPSLPSSLSTAVPCGTPSLPPLAYGYVASSFGYQDAAQYFGHLLKLRCSDWVAISGADGRYGELIVLDLRPVHNTLSPGHPVIGVSMDLDSRCHSVPQDCVLAQRIWRPQSELDYHRHVSDAALERPIFFLHNNGRLGLAVASTLSGDFSTLRSVSQPVNMGGKTTTTVRIHLYGVPAYKCQIHIRDDTPNRAPIVLGRLIRLLGRQVADFLNKNGMGARGLNSETTIIVGVVQVSAGCWMPILAQAASHPFSTISY